MLGVMNRIIQLAQHRDVRCAVTKRVMSIHTHKMWRTVCVAVWVLQTDTKMLDSNWGCRTKGKRIALLPGNEATDCPTDWSGIELSDCAANRLSNQWIFSRDRPCQYSMCFFTFRRRILLPSSRIYVKMSDHCAMSLVEYKLFCCKVPNYTERIDLASS